MNKVFPAHAGVIPSCKQQGGQYEGFPRTCGGDPNTFAPKVDSIGFSPHMRG